ncbi:MAG: hypothetical protein KDA28_03130, partial [Phycisphaerales bacterium]|nr:hypothetical protein [Phycisphaerales bacterium]
MTTLTGILEWPQRAEGRIRQFGENVLLERADDPFVPMSFGDQFNLRPGLEVTVQVENKKPRRRRKGKPRTSRPVVESFVAIEGMD